METIQTIDAMWHTKLGLPILQMGKNVQKPNSSALIGFRNLSYLVWTVEAINL